VGDGDQHSDSQVEALLSKLDIRQRFPAPAKIGLVLAALLLIFAGLLPFLQGNPESWSSGPLADSHQLLAGNCRACHNTPFARVKDSACLECHRLSPHAQSAAFKKAADHSRLQIPCGDCHIEHRGAAGMVISEPQLCTGCHGDIKSVSPQATGPDVASFNAHPEFAVAVQPLLPGQPAIKVKLDDPARLIDNGRIKLNHKLHLKLIQGPNGYEQLQCSSCHQLTEELRLFKPIEFETNCQRCHPLNFDERLAAREVPHGPPDKVFAALLAEFTGLLGNYQSPDRVSAEDQDRRNKPGEPPASLSTTKSSVVFSADLVQQAAREAERQLFTRTACKLCHAVEPAPAVPEAAASGNLSRFSIINPEIPKKWFTAANFSHGAHELLRCTECHAGVEESEQTADILIPRIEKCRACHVQGPPGAAVLQPGMSSFKRAGIKSDCTVCHSYHAAQPLPVERKRSLEDLFSISVSL